MKLLVTGGCGFIGSAVVRLAVSRGHEVVNLDAMTYAANAANVASVAQSNLYSFEQADIRDRAALDRIFATVSTAATSTCHLFDNGRFYGWEGEFCCAGTCACTVNAPICRQL